MTKHTILFLAANPLGTDQLALDLEVRAIRVELERSGHGDQFKLETRGAAEPLDLLRELRKLKPTIVHFSGHGGRGELQQSAGPRRDIVAGPGAADGSALDGDHQYGLFFQGPDGRAQLVSTGALEKTFGAAGSSVKLVVLNACYSDVQAEALLRHVECVVGMGGSIRDDAARSFAVGFYGGLGDCASVAAAYSQGCAAISLEGLPDSERPQLKVRDGVDAAQIILADSNTGQKPDQPAAADAAPARRGWTWYSTVESAKADDVSMLAIAETIAASTLYAWIASRFGTLHLTISACVAPFLLLRTECSVSLALDWFGRTVAVKRVNDKSLKDDHARRLASVLVDVVIGLHTALLSVFMAGATIALRVGATVATVVTQPLKSISEIPHNWLRSITRVDSRSPLEMLPGASQHFKFDMYVNDVVLTPWNGIRNIQREVKGNRYYGLVFYGFFLPIFVITLLLPALFYRWSLKGSALIYSPLIWIAHGATARSLRVHLEDILKRAYYRIKRRFAPFVLLLFAAKVYVHYAWSDLASWWRAIPGHGLLDAVAMPETFPQWQITSVVNAIFEWVLYLAADWVLARMNRSSQVNEKAIEVVLRWLSLVRGVLSIYTIVCCIYLAASLSGRFNLPPMGTGILPWR